ncbi:hypothetical protein JYK22_20080 [Nonomuraea sp. RK-328]|nr:hypothetical protein [Nonomuraea sp. RK-328]
MLNASLYLLAQPMTGEGARWLVGEGGALTSVATALVVLATRPLWRGPNPFGSSPLTRPAAIR